MRLEIDLDESVIRDAVAAQWVAQFRSGYDRGDGAKAVARLVSESVRSVDCSEMIAAEVRRQMPIAVRDAVAVAVAAEVRRVVGEARKGGALQLMLQEQK